jgi:hypothetical protein
MSGREPSRVWLRAAVVERVPDEPEDDAEHCVADRRLAEGSAVGGELRQLQGYRCNNRRLQRLNRRSATS